MPAPLPPLRAWTVRVCAGLVLLLPATRATASLAIDLTWRTADPRCPTQAELRARVSALLGDAAVALTADATIHPPEGTTTVWRLDLGLRWARGRDDRTLTASSCSSLADATVVLVTVLAAPLAMSGRLGVVAPAPRTPEPVVPEPEPPALPDPPAEPAPVPPPATPVLPPPLAAPAPAPASPGPARTSVTSEPLDAADATHAPRDPPPAPTRTRRRGPFFRIAAVAGYATLPRVDLGLQLAAGALLPRLRLEGALVFLPPQPAVFPDGRGAAPGFAAASFRACPRFLGGPVELSLCGALELGASWARSLGVDPRRQAAGPWLAFALGPALDLWLAPRVALSLGLEALAAPVATTYALGERLVDGGRHFGVRGVLGLTFALAQQDPARPEK